jgi:aspartokinase
MNKISDAIDALLSQNPFLQFGLEEDLLNLSKVSQFLNPLVAAKTKKEVTNSAILMHLSRSNQKKKREKEQKGNGTPSRRDKEEFHLNKLTIHSNLATITYINSQELYRKIRKLHDHVKKQNQFFICTEGAFQVTIIFEENAFETVQKIIPENHQYSQRNLSCLISSFSEEDLNISGLIYHVLQKLYFQNINIIEVASTATELSIFLKEEDTRLAFDTIYHSFLRY